MNSVILFAQDGNRGFLPGGAIGGAIIGGAIGLGIGIIIAIIKMFTGKK